MVYWITLSKSVIIFKKMFDKIKIERGQRGVQWRIGNNIILKFKHEHTTQRTLTARSDASIK